MESLLHAVFAIFISIIVAFYYVLPMGRTKTVTAKLTLFVVVISVLLIGDATSKIILAILFVLTYLLFVTLFESLEFRAYSYVRIHNVPKVVMCMVTLDCIAACFSLYLSASIADVIYSRLI